MKLKPLIPLTLVSGVLSELYIATYFAKDCKGYPISLVSLDSMANLGLSIGDSCVNFEPYSSQTIELDDINALEGEYYYIENVATLVKSGACLGFSEAKCDKGSGTIKLYEKEDCTGRILMQESGECVSFQSTAQSQNSTSFWSTVLSYFWSRQD